MIPKLRLTSSKIERENLNLGLEEMRSQRKCQKTTALQEI